MNLFIVLLHIINIYIIKLQHTTSMLAREYTWQKAGYWHNYVLKNSKYDDHVSYVICSI